MLSKQIPLGIYEKALPAGDELNQPILLNNKYIFKYLPINSPQYSPQGVVVIHGGILNSVEIFSVMVQ
ncbi:TPA: hypothetical protein ACH73O_004016 [Escherichia coli]|uniref:hypothetical protein n=1 Tax=Escherichia coli TaxID=562 RepID=UPI0003BB3578|nr:hypothetical protein [Escherichia coli]APT64421.1 hypothetical protein BUE82_22360 [Escherichia coli]EFC9703549.1 hypothetical protein [Escherichia coli]EFH5868953.1 hypothetical protein [Escherichia coli]EFH6221697.1 hypothetical protein [Escherichia coli]EFI1517530.1 hypothetical protein [Escherichia coli]